MEVEASRQDVVARRRRRRRPGAVARPADARPGRGRAAARRRHGGRSLATGRAGRAAAGGGAGGRATVAPGPGSTAAADASAWVHARAAAAAGRLDVEAMIRELRAAAAVVAARSAMFGPGVGSAAGPGGGRVAAVVVMNQ